ncbi:TIGR02117 family protein [Phaeobacter sp. CNT1-3]|nr:TIGR02117 family protein [Phaeobacter sp. CNT1-3]
MIGGAVTWQAQTTPSAAMVGQDSDAVTIGLVSGPIHNDFLLPLDDQARDRFSDLAAFHVPIDHPQAEWLMIGWGARMFYTTVGDYQDVSVQAVLRGVFGDQSVMRVEVLGPIGNPDMVSWVQVTSAQYQSLIAAIDSDFGPERRTVKTDGALRGTFFAAKDRFHIFNTCNVWVGRTMRDAGVQFGAWTPLPASISLSVWRFHSP